jgi:predicted enzyme related to lactoylglutathione lyase
MAYVIYSVNKWQIEEIILISRVHEYFTFRLYKQKVGIIKKFKKKFMNMHKMNPVVHFELPGEDMGRMRNFYEKAFGWETKQLGEDMGNYVVVTTTETDEKNMVKTPGAINGGFYEKTSDPLSNYPSVVISVDDIEKAMKMVREAGGKVLGGQKKDGTPDEIPGVGLFSSIIDTEGNRLSILQPKGMPM